MEANHENLLQERCLRDTPTQRWSGGGGRTAAQTREHLFRHCSRLRDQQKTLHKLVGKETAWKVGKCRHAQISELLSIQECNQVVMDFLAATDVGKFPAQMDDGMEEAQRRAQVWGGGDGGL